MNTAWTELENVALVAAYLGMMQKHNAGVKFNKAAIRRELIGTAEAKGALFCRSNGSIEMKLMNVSGCMRSLGRPELPGYLPAMSYQKSLMSEVCKQLGITAGKSTAA